MHEGPKIAVGLGTAPAEPVRQCEACRERTSTAVLGAVGPGMIDGFTGPP